MDPFLYGDVENADPQKSAWLRGLEHVESNLERWAKDMSQEGFWWTPVPGVVNPVAALVRHIGGSSLRLLHYAQGVEVSDALREEGAHDWDLLGSDRDEVYQLCVDRLAVVRAGLWAFDESDYAAVRHVGRKQIPVRTTLIVQHLLEHAHAHAAQVIVMRKLHDSQGS